MRSPSVHLLLLLVLLAAGNVAWTLRRSGIPHTLVGRIERIEVRHEKHPGVDDVHLVTVGERTLHLDAAVAEALREGDVLSKAAWSDQLVTPRATLSLGWSLDARRMLIAMPLLVLLAGLALFVRRKPSSQEPPGE